MIPYIVGLLVAYLEADEDVAAIVGTRIGTKTPRTLTKAWVRIQVIDERQAPRSSADHLVTAYVQLDCYAGEEGDEVAAATLARTVRASLVAMPGEHDEGTVTSVRVGSRPLPDVDLEAIDRHIVTGTVVAHP